ncbi:TlyA family RNA methyltransferase [uncultured Ilyobacter sp.]|jgi:23S rRNA (cytidine1920-2'-O)/16S rRNA (cytidine1409-2'-O)-methyltransferase|uniref:TlyA family RNA methyltransferase n=1 Tax=uncultured Ilyobacter sp. TaxID=544433 RepID=UPI0029C00277|nr:TlyA family RNA methyltransferase [uncultured Ilyobacter sp.]
MKERLDVLLVEQGFFETREKAKRAIMAGIVIVDDKKIEKPGTQIKIDKEPEIRIKGQALKYVSRGGLKLEKAIEVFDLNMKDKIVLDIGASTGGFTDCALQNGAKYVYSADVGSNQLDWKLRNDERVKSIENTHIKDLKLEDVDGNKADYLVMDVSFISITKVFEHLIKFMKNDSELMALIKPQFEVGRENIEKGGIVKDFKKHKMAIEKIIEAANSHGLYLKSLDYSPITGGKGNVEYLSIFSLENGNNEIDIDEVINRGKSLKTGG